MPSNASCPQTGSGRVEMHLSWHVKSSARTVTISIILGLSAIYPILLRRWGCINKCCTQKKSSKKDEPKKNPQKTQQPPFPVYTQRLKQSFPKKKASPWKQFSKSSVCSDLKICFQMYKRLKKAVKKNTRLHVEKA